MTIEYKDSKRIVKLSSDVVETPTYTANYDDTNTWTKTGTKVTVNETVSGKVNWDFSTNYTSAENHLETTPLGFTLDNEKWVCDFEFNASAFDNLAETFLVVFQENAGDFISTSGDGLACSIYANKTVRLWKKDASTHSIDSNPNAITIATGTDYYARFSRTSATVIKFELFTDSARTVHVSGSPITFTFSETIQGLDNLTHCGRSDNVGSTRTYNVSLDNLKIWNGVTSVSSKPTNVQDNSLLIEKDIGNRFWFNNNLTFEDDFSSDNWTDKDSMGVSGGILTGANVLDGGDDTSYYDLTSTSDTNWILRFKGTYTTTYGTGGSSKVLYVGLSSDINAQNTAKDFAGFIFEQWNLPQFKIAGGVVNNATLELASDLSNLSALDTTSATTVTNYFEIKRDGNDFTFTVYSNSDYTGQLATVARTVSSVTTLRYLVLTNRDLSGSNTGSLTVSVDDLEFYNGVTTPATWTNEDIFTDDYSSDSGWTSVGSNTTVNSAVAGKVNMTGDIDNWVYKDLGFNLKSKWIARGNIKATVYGTTGCSLVPVTFIDDPTVHVKNGTGNNGIGIFMDTTGGTRYFWLSIITNGAYDRGTNDSNHRISFATGTTYYYELIRDGSTLTLRITTNSDFSGGSVITRTTTLPSNTFRYLVHGTDVATSGSNTVEADDTVVHNGVTSIN